MPSSRKCIFGCKGDGPLFKTPKDAAVRKQWLDFIFGDEHPAKNVYVCARHFTDDCFLNKSLFDNGQISRLSLKEGAMLTLKKEPEPPCPPAAPPTRIPHSAYSTRTVCTQLSAGTLRLQHYRSRTVQATVGSTSRGTSTEEPTCDFGERAPKRPRVKMEEGEDDDLNSIPASEDSTHEPGDTVPDLSDWINMKSPDFEDAKYIVFESALRELFENCPVCQKQCIMDQHRCGTFVAFSQNCPHCSFSRKWQSQPLKDNIPQGNLELSAAVYFNGGSFPKIERICSTMNLKVHPYDAFRRHTRNYLEPAVYHKWKADQAKVLEEMKRKGKIAVSGDTRAGSTRDSVKFGSFTMMELEDEKILDVQVVQRNEEGSCENMEREGLRRSLELLESNSVQVDYVVTDRRPEVQKYLQEREMSHYYGVQHVMKGLSKELEALAKKRDCRAVKKLLPSIKKHMFRTACSSTTGPEKVDKWTSLVDHMLSVHSHNDPSFPKCVPRIRASTDGRKSFRPGTTALNKVCKLLLNKRILEDVSKLSSNHQTSALESFHSLILRFAPKNSNFSFTEQLCRLYLAAMHHNENSKRQRAMANQKPVWKLRFPRSPKERATARATKSDPTFRYRNSLMQLVLTEVLEDPARFQKELREVDVTPPLGPQYDVPLKEEIVAFQISEFYPVEAGSRHGSFLDLRTAAKHAV